MRTQILLVALLCVFQLACGGANLARRGDQQLAQGQYDAAIASYDAAARASASDPQEAASFQKKAKKARVYAAHLQVDEGDQAFRRKDLKAAGEAYKKARSYAPADALVVDRLATLLKTRVRIEAQLDSAWKELNALQRANKKASLPRWQELVAVAEGCLSGAKTIHAARRSGRRSRGRRAW